MNQLGFFDRDGIEERFLRFHNDNPHVYATLRSLALRAYASGKRRIGVGALWERMRWEIWMDTSGDEEFKLNNDFRSRYARLLMRQEPALAGIFETRRLRSA